MSDGGHECPTCGRDDFSSERVMKIHHAKEHGESIAGFTYTCDWCGEEFNKKNRTDSKRVFCSNECFTEAKSEMFSEVREQQRKRVTLVCDYCDNDFEVIESRERRARYCTEECRDSDAPTGEDHPQWSRVTLICEYCNDEYQCKQSRAEGSRFCSPGCRSSHMSENWVGENHHNWKEEEIAADYYGPSWSKQRQRARDRDDHRCQVCGASDEVHVHHIRPFREFGVENHEQANALDNLICLCPHHHAEWEGIPLRPDTGDATAD